MPRNSLRHLCILAVVGGVGASIGCGTGAYEEAMAVQLVELQHRSRFHALHGPTTLDPFPVSVRLPILTDESTRRRVREDEHWFQTGSAYHDDNAVPEELLHPPGMTGIPGFLRMGEAASLTPDEYLIRYEFYVGVVDAKEISLEDVCKDVYSQIRAVDLKIEQPWTPVECETLEHKKTPWLRLRTTGKQRFLQYQYSRGSHNGVERDLPGRIDVYVRELGRYVVVWVVRAADMTSERIDVLGVAEAAAATFALVEERGDKS